MSLRRSQIIQLAAMPIAEVKPEKKSGEKVPDRHSTPGRGADAPLSAKLDL